MNNREKARRLQEEAETNEGEQVEALQEQVNKLLVAYESLVESIASLEEENLELKRAMENQGRSLSS